MNKRCVYCKSDIYDDRSLDVCNNCGLKVWGERMFNAILQNMDNANLSVNEPPSKFGNARISFG